MKSFSRLKVPSQYREIFMSVIQHYPELENTHIHVVLKKKHPVPYGTTPAFRSLFLPSGKRVYRIAILEEAKPPLEQVLFKNLTETARKGVVAHEFVHIIQFQKCSAFRLIGYMFSYPFPAFERRLEKNADRGAVDHGYGNELYEHAVYIRSVPGYVESRPEVNTNYLHPDEIAAYMRSRYNNDLSGKQTGT